MIGFALVLLLASAAAWIAANGARSRARSYLRLACVLYATMAIAELFALAPVAVTDIVMTLGAVVLCIGAFAGLRRNPKIITASVALALAALAAIAAATLGLAVLAAVPQVVSALFVFLTARRSLFLGRRSGLYLALSSFCLVGAAACHLAPGMMAQAGLLLFASSAVAGVALASNFFVEEHRRKIRGMAIGRASRRP